MGRAFGGRSSTESSPERAEALRAKPRRRRRLEPPGCLTFFRSAARGLHVPTKLTREPTEHEARKRRANERPRVGCCEELGGEDIA